MIAEAIEKIQLLANPEKYEINGETYSTNKNLFRVAPHIDRPEKAKFSSLDAITQALRVEICNDVITKPVFLNVSDHNRVTVFTTYRPGNLQRDVIYEAAPCLPAPLAPWSCHDDAIIALRSQFVPNDGVEYILGLLSRISSDDSVSSEDNGVSQEVTAITGVALKTNETVRPRVLLAPYRTFLEVEQPESEFLLRVKPGDKESKIPPKIGIIEADGGAWKLAARKNIADYFRKSLSDLITRNLLIVAE